MQQLFFWRRWPSAESALYTIFLIVLALLSLAALTYHFLGPEALIGWETYAQAEFMRLTTRPVKYDFFNLDITVDANIFWQYFTGGEEIIARWSYNLFLVLLGIGVATLATSISYTRKFWYFVGVSLLIGGLTTLDFELLYIFGLDNKVPLAIVLGLFVPATYYFNKINHSARFIHRWLVFIGIVVLIGIMIGFFAESPLPFMTLSTSSIYLAMGLSMIFVLMVGHEILIAILTALTGQSGALRHFLLFCGIYLLYLLLTYLHETSLISWDLIYINLILLLIISGTLGIWGFRKRESQYSYLMDFGPGGAFFYVSMMLIAIATLTHLEITMNDPAIEVFRDFTVMGHLAFGVIFLAYMLANFASPLGEGLAVHKIMFQPSTMPYFTFRLAGIIMFVGLLFPSGTKTSIYQTQSAYYNGLGDLAMIEGEPLFALRYYEEGASYGYNNHKSNYSLGKFHIGNNDFTNAITPLKRAVEKWPTPQSFVDLSRAYLETSQPYEALFALKNGAARFPDNYEVLNNLGLAYNEINVLDSAYLSLDQAHNLEAGRDIAGANIAGMFGKNEIPYDADSLISLYANEKNALSLVNGYVLKNQQMEPWDRSLQEYDSALSFIDAAVMYNQTLNALYADDTFNTSKLNKYLQYEGNIGFREQLEVGEIMNHYRNQSIDKAFRKINGLANWSQEYGHQFYEIGGKWALEQNAPRVAYQYFDWSLDRQPFGSKLLLAMAATEAKMPEAPGLWQEIRESDNKSESETAVFMLNILTMDKNGVSMTDDVSRTAYLNFVQDPADTISYISIWEGIGNGDLKVQSILHACRKLIEKGDIDRALPLFENVGGISVSSPDLLTQIKWMELELLAAHKNISLLAQQINDNVTFDPAHEVHKQYFSGLIKAASNDPGAIDNFRNAGRMNPFYEDAVVASASFISSKDKFEAYDLLIKALEVNPESIPLLKAYILQCARVQLNNYASLSLDTLRELVPSEEFNAFYTQYIVLAQQVEEEENTF